MKQPSLMNHVKLAGFSLYRRYLKAASLAPIVLRSKLLYNIKDSFITIRDSTQFTTSQRMELISRGSKDLLLLQKAVLLPEEIQVLDMKKKMGLTSSQHQHHQHQQDQQQEKEEELKVNGR